MTKDRSRGDRFDGFDGNEMIGNEVTKYRIGEGRSFGTLIFLEIENFSKIVRHERLKNDLRI